MATKRVREQHRKAASPRSDERAKPLTSSQQTTVRAKAQGGHAVSTIKKGATAVSNAASSNKSGLDDTVNRAAKSVNKVRKTGKAVSHKDFDGKTHYAWDGTKKEFRDEAKMDALGAGMTKASATRYAHMKTKSRIKGKNNHKGRNDW